MTFKTTALAASALLAGGILALAAPLSASAHIEIDPSSAAAGSYTVLSFALPHGCTGSPTTSISIAIPESIASVTPTVNPLWTVAKTETPLATPITDDDGNSITTRIGGVVYTAITPMADGLRTTFDLSLMLPADAAGTTLEFPVVQTCVTGSTNWDAHTVEGEAEPEHPAPSIAVTAAVASDEHGAAHTDTTTEASSEATAASASAPDVLARVLGVGGLVVGVVGLVLAITARRKHSA
ncbi:DUF1775 domain-containing protein [Cryobacterium algoricola]|uniref:DUF1775 domain-containing protein n=1 Tax=Cryobacterium algoricola TaxID=1259183 RepID=A0ABY2IDL1_9MICO|nr:YcnI family protein [Cryobacterium algoricola]TFB86219.1 DUF1775 domain-containing protein [Cryobacterium algoricola]